MEEKEIIELIRKISFKDEVFPARGETWKQIQKNIIRCKRKRALLHVKYWSVASVAILLCLMIGVGSSSIDLKSGSTPLDIRLPDGSTVNLSASSSLAYNKLLWRFVRRVTLNGEATFTVAKGHRFSVVTPLGTVSVLGTSFFVSQQDNNLHVSCFEGSVCVKTDEGKEILFPGEQVDCTGSRMSRSEIPETKEELPEYIEYENAPLDEVARRMEELYGLHIVNIELCEGLLFSGFMSTGNRDEAMEIVFGVCNLKYAIKGNILTLTR